MSLFELWRSNGEEKDGCVHLEDANLVTFELALQVIAAAGFGYSVSWGEEEVPSGHKLVSLPAFRIST